MSDYFAKLKAEEEAKERARDAARAKIGTEGPFAHIARALDSVEGYGSVPELTSRDFRRDYTCSSPPLLAATDNSTPITAGDVIDACYPFRPGFALHIMAKTPGYSAQDFGAALRWLRAALGPGHNATEMIHGAEPFEERNLPPLTTAATMLRPDLVALFAQDKETPLDDGYGEWLATPLVAAAVGDGETRGRPEFVGEGGGGGGAAGDGGEGNGGGSSASSTSSSALLIAQTVDAVLALGADPNVGCAVFSDKGPAALHHACMGSERTGSDGSFYYVPLPEADAAVAALLWGVQGKNAGGRDPAANARARGFNLEAKDDEGRTPLQVALAAGRDRAAAMLREAGAKEPRARGGGGGGGGGGARRGGGRR